jgi:hypothetical protein
MSETNAVTMPENSTETTLTETPTVLVCAGEGAYVWVTAWDTERDAEQFHRAYVDLLESQGASNPRGNVYIVPDSSDFGDAFRVVKSGDRVRIVNAPNADQLDDVHEPRD